MQISLFEKSDAEILNLVNPIMDNMMAGSTAIDHAMHTRDFSDRIKNIVTPEYLDRVCQDYQQRWGIFTKREFVALFRRRHSIAVVWRQYCSLTTDEYVAEAVFIENDGRLLIDHTWVY